MVFLMSHGEVTIRVISKNKKTLLNIFFAIILLLLLNVIINIMKIKTRNNNIPICLNNIASPVKNPNKTIYFCFCFTDHKDIAKKERLAKIIKPTSLYGSLTT